ncbi:hypothetical protein NHG95_28450 [Pseudomonas corrugata]|uniref:hypothetical protein n=1 Tax=Pseudomonas corrugata TaxID=47879 RepID=UPI0028C42D59|nr:hypothetical protein [Pseudomonas corrugata]MDU9037066.1 hypothetical protein [Pseudomonas corrugata]
MDAIKIKVTTVVYVVNFYFCFIRYSALSVLAVFLIDKLSGQEGVVPFFMAGIACLPKAIRLLMHNFFDKKTALTSHASFSLGSGLAMMLWAESDSILLMFVAVFMMEFCYLCASIKTKLIITELSATKLYRAFSKLAVVNNIAACCGPLLAAGAISIGKFNLFCLFVVLFSMPIALLSLRLNKLELDSHFSSSAAAIERADGVEENKSLKMVLCLSAVVCFFYAQINSALPLAVNENLGGVYLGGVYAINSICVICFSLWINQKIEVVFSSFFSKIVLGLMVFGLAFFILWVGVSIYNFVLAISIFTVAEIITLPALSEAVAISTPAHQKSLAFTFSSIATSVGEGVGMFVGTFLMGYQQLDMAYVFLIFASSAAMSATTISLLCRR